MEREEAQVGKTPARLEYRSCNGVADQSVVVHVRKKSDESQD